jgi:polysaccharide export outer membrane protein
MKSPSERWFRLLATTFLIAAAAARTIAADTDPQTPSDHGPASLPFPLSSVVAEDYRLQPLDLVVFELYDEPEATTQQRLSGRGDLRLPMLGSVPLKGLTVREAEAKLEGLYRNGGFYKDPQVTLYAAQHAERTISVLGQVNRPDRFPLQTGTDTIGLSQAIAMAGGLTRIASASSVEISRMTPDGDKRFVVNLSAYLNAKKAGSASDFQLQSDDIVFVPERTI